MRIDVHHFFHEDPAAVDLRPILESILKEQQKISMDTSALKTAFSSFQTDFSKFVTDVNDKLTALAANQQNPADQQAVNDIASGLTAMDANVQAMDAALNPPAADPAAPTA